jgi:hypothetical protein
LPFCSNQRIQTASIWSPRRFTEPPASPQRVFESFTLACRDANTREHQPKMMFEQVLQQAARNRIAHVGLRMFSPPQNKFPYFFWVRDDKLILNRKHPLPARIPPTSIPHAHGTTGQHAFKSI